MEKPRKLCLSGPCKGKGDLAHLIGGKGGTKNEKTEKINFSVGDDFIHDAVFLECERFGW
jgi:hypothetical protein